VCSSDLIEIASIVIIGFSNFILILQAFAKESAFR
jgi:hypothetical protein